MATEFGAGIVENGNLSNLNLDVLIVV